MTESPLTTAASPNRTPTGNHLGVVVVDFTNTFWVNIFIMPLFTEMTANNQKLPQVAAPKQNPCSSKALLSFQPARQLPSANAAEEKWIWITPKNSGRTRIHEQQSHTNPHFSIQLRKVNESLFQLNECRHTAMSEDGRAEGHTKYLPISFSILEKTIPKPWQVGFLFLTNKSLPTAILSHNWPKKNNVGALFEQKSGTGLRCTRLWKLPHVQRSLTSLLAKVSYLNYYSNFSLAPELLISLLQSILLPSSLTLGWLQLRQHFLCVAEDRTPHQGWRPDALLSERIIRKDLLGFLASKVTSSDSTLFKRYSHSLDVFCC